LVIEVLSPSETRKQIRENLRDYESISVEEARLVSPEARTVEVLELQNGGLERLGLLAEGILRPKHFPNIQIDVAEIWPE
jgi:Uma2 family endonuclease